jgi:hypothetical protein
MRTGKNACTGSADVLTGWNAEGPYCAAMG